MIVHIILGSISGAIIGAGAALALDLCTCVFYIITINEQI